MAHPRIFAAVLLWSVLSFACLPAPSSAPAEPTDRDQIRQALEQWPRDFNRKDKEATCALFAPDLVASYPGLPDRDFEAMRKSLITALDHPTRTFRYDAPHIEEILVSGDLAVVRLIWTSRVIDNQTRDEVLVRERGIDVLKRQKDGKWKVSISHAYPEPAPTTTRQ
jgi:ketosteroid isomerase-like protein